MRENVVAMDDDIVNNARPEGATMKRSASSGADTMAEYYGQSSKKAARLDDDRSSLAGKGQRGESWREGREEEREREGKGM